MSNILKSGRKVHIVTFLDAWDAALLHSQADCPSHLAKCICMVGGQIELFVFNLFQTLTCIQQNQGLLTFLKSSQLCGSECCVVFIIINDNQNSDVILCSMMEERGRGGKNSKSSLDTQVIFSVSAFCLKSSSSSMTTNLGKSLFVSQTLSIIKDWDVVGHQYNQISVQSHDVRFKLSLNNQLFALHHNLN